MVNCLTFCRGSFVFACTTLYKLPVYVLAQPSPAQPSPAQPSPHIHCVQQLAFMSAVQTTPTAANQQPLHQQTTHQLQSRHSRASCHGLSPCCWYAGCAVCRKAARLACLHPQQQCDAEVAAAAHGWPPTEQAVCSCGQTKHR